MTAGRSDAPQRSEAADKTAIVIGAGIVGVCSAWYLQRSGFQVTVVDRQPPGSETSWGNLGLIQHLPPGAFPRDFNARVGIAMNRRNDVQVRMWGVLSNLSAIVQYWWCSTPSRYQQVVADYGTLVKRCTDEHETMMRAADAQHLVRKAGFYEISSKKSVEELQPAAQHLRAAGVAVDVISGVELEAKEPALTRGYFQAALFFKDTWCITDPGSLVKAYAAHFVSQGGVVVRASVVGLMPPGTQRRGASPDRWVVQTDSGNFEAAHVVVAAGPWSMELLRPMGYNFSLYPLRGYNTHFSIRDGAPQLTASMVEMENGIGISPMTMGVRITTGGELTTISAPPHEEQLQADIVIAKRFLPLGEQVTKVWHGSRPCLPDMKPVIGPAPRHEGLWMCFGHGGNGMTLAAVSGRLLSELVSGNKQPFINPAPFAASRFS